MVQKYREKTILLIKWGKIRGTLVEAEEGIEFIHKTDYDSYMILEF